MCFEPGNNPLLKFLRRDGNCAAVVCGWYCPQLYGRVSCADKKGMAAGDVAVHCTLYEQHWYMGVRNSIFRRGLRQVHVILDSSDQQRDLNDGTQDCSSDPIAGAEALAHAVVGDLAK